MQAVATNAEAGGLREAVHSNDLATLERMLATRTHDTGQQWTDEVCKLYPITLLTFKEISRPQEHMVNARACVIVHAEIGCIATCC